MKLRIFCLAALGCAALQVGPATAQNAGAPLQLQSKQAPPAGTGKRQAPAAPPPVQLYDGATVIAKANAYLNSMSTMIADFVQIGPDHRRTEGTLSLARPGRLRFQYAPPATLEVIADGTDVAIRDGGVGSQQLYFINQTPLKFLLKDKVDLARDTRVTNVTDDQNAATIDISDSVTFGGTTNIELVFDPVTFALKQWTVTDAQGYKTLVTLFDVDLNTKPDPGLFTINQAY